MKISTSYSYCNSKQSLKPANTVYFGHHPDFNRLVEKRPICYSRYFRRENTLSGPQLFRDIVDVFRKVFTGSDEPKKMLVAGIAHSEEPFSYLSVIKQLNKQKPIEDVLDLYIIDLQSKPDASKLFNDSYTMDYIPYYAKESFVYEPHPHIPLYDYRVSDEIFKFLYNTYNNTTKSNWESRVQEADYPENHFDIISVNNILYYIPEYLVLPTFDNLCKSVKPGGYIIAEDDRYAANCNNKNNLIRCSGGIYRKV